MRIDSPLAHVVILGLLSAACGEAVLPCEQRFPDPPRRLALASPEPRTVVRVDGVALSLHDSDPNGTRPVIFCLHAIGHGGADFSGFAHAFADHYRIIIIDWPGHGASAQDPTPASAARYRVLFSGLVEQLRIDRFVILGNSIGGALAVGYAAEHPERARGLILANPGGFDPGGFFAGLYIGMLKRHFRAGANGEAGYAGWYRDYYEDILITADAAAERRAIVDSAYETAPRLLEAWESFATPAANQRALAPRLTMPVLVTWARADKIVQWSRNRDAIESIPKRRVVMFEAGHSPFLEKPDAFNREVAAFLRALPL